MARGKGKAPAKQSSLRAAGLLPTLKKPAEAVGLHPGGQGVVCIAHTNSDQLCMCPGCKTLSDGEEVPPTRGVLPHHGCNRRRSRGEAGEGSAQPLF